MEALGEWEKARSGPNADSLPNHRVGISVLAGASAGAITAAVGADSPLAGKLKFTIMLAEGQLLLDIFGIVAALGPTWKDQTRFKPDELVLAAHPDIDDRRN